ncbi:MAG: hypothetical protein DRJ67_11585 [Thermoprotei archaeon]|nr:MAG: hypothetical protein DRJ67_11585 [Thermoprotei archaeon]
MSSSDGLPDEIWDAAEKVASYLSVLLAVEYDIDVVDRIAKARKLDDFMEGIYNALRRRYNLEDTILKQMGKETNEERRKALSDAIGIIRGLNPSHLEKLRSLNRGALKLVASYIGSRALAYTRTVGMLMQIFHGGR